VIYEIADVNHGQTRRGNPVKMSNGIVRTVDEADRIDLR